MPYTNLILWGTALVFALIYLFDRPTGAGKKNEIRESFLIRDMFLFMAVTFVYLALIINPNVATASTQITTVSSMTTYANTTYTYNNYVNYSVFNYLFDIYTFVYAVLAILIGLRLFADFMQIIEDFNG